MNHRIAPYTALFGMAVLVTAGSVVAPANAETPILELQPLTANLDRPVVITHAGDGTNRLFIGEQTGAIQIVTSNGTLLATPFLDIDAQSACCGERGLLGIAFHPDYGTNRTFFVHYSDGAGDTVISKFLADATDPDLADLASEVVLLTVDQPFSNHNGGEIGFGPDGYLYIALGDGGSAEDPGDRGQNMSILLGKLLRIDVDNPDPGLEYGIPADNPFVGVGGVREEIWASGLRNPWRFSFDRLTGDLFIGDVGQYRWEEIDFQPAASTGGENWGWRCYEGDEVFNFSNCDVMTDFDFPILTYFHSGGNCSVTGGYRYRGPAYPNLRGVYLYGDYCTGKIWGATETGGTWSSSEVLDAPFSLGTFGEDEAGELYVSNLSSYPTGAVHRIVDTSDASLIFDDGFESGSTDQWSSVSP